MKLRYTLLFFSICILLWSCNEPIDNPKIYSFSVVGHAYGSPSEEVLGLDNDFMHQIDLINSDSLILMNFFTGDLVKNASQDAWDLVKSDLEKLKKPYYISPGNHDVQDINLYQSIFGETYSSLTLEGDLFLILDANINNWNIEGAQLEFVKNALNSHDSDKGNIFIFTHQVIWLDKEPYINIGYNSPEGKAEELTFWTELAPLFTSMDCQSYFFAGDVGAFDWATPAFYHEEDNLCFIASGIGGRVKDNYILVDVYENKEVKFRLISTDPNKDLGNLQDY